MKSFALNKNRAFAGWMAQYISEILLHLDRNLIPEAQEWAEKAIELDGKNGMRLLLARDYALEAEDPPGEGRPGKEQGFLRAGDQNIPGVRGRRLLEENGTGDRGRSLIPASRRGSVVKEFFPRSFRILHPCLSLRISPPFC